MADPVRPTWVLDLTERSGPMTLRRANQLLQDLTAAHAREPELIRLTPEQRELIAAPYLPDGGAQMAELFGIPVTVAGDG